MDEKHLCSYRAKYFAEIQALVGCQVDNCAKEVSYPLDMVRLFKGKPICQNCYEGWLHDYYDISLPEDNTIWGDLPKITLEMLIA